MGPPSEALRCSVLALLDLPTSTSGITAGSTQPLLAFEQEAALLSAQARQGCNAIHGFAFNIHTAVWAARRLGVQRRGIVADRGLPLTCATFSAGATTAWPRPLRSCRAIWRT